MQETETTPADESETEQADGPFAPPGDIGEAFRDYVESRRRFVATEKAVDAAKRSLAAAEKASDHALVEFRMAVDRMNRLADIEDS